MAIARGGSSGTAAFGVHALLLFTGSLQTAQADSVINIIGSLKTFRDGTVELFTTTAKTLKEGGQAEEAEKVTKWNNDWLSLLGVSKGITGLAKDFVVNYLGRSAYHDSNGQLIDTIKKAAAVYPTGKPDSDDIKYLRKGVLEVCSEGMKVFAEGGSLHQMLSELKDILDNESNSDHFAKGITNNPAVKKAFDYLSGDKDEL